MSRIAFARKFGAEPHNPRNAWSYINHEERFVMFGAWSHVEEDGRQQVFSESWKKDANGRKPASYGPSLRHIEHILEDGYTLYTFRQYADPDSLSGIPRISNFDEIREKRSLNVVGRDYFAVEESTTSEMTSEIEPTLFTEGLRFDVVQTHFERNRAARQKCLELHGSVCKVCHLNFEDVYGEIGKGFIHIHHIVPVAHRRTQYKLDPKTDLIPVCPNCHAMLHKRVSDPYSPEELQDIMFKKSKSRS
ncbi:MULTISPECIES: HNH endonuclease [unclassified Marinovum]